MGCLTGQAEPTPRTAAVWGRETTDQRTGELGPSCGSDERTEKQAAVTGKMELWGDLQRAARGRIEGKMDVERGEWFRFIDRGRVLFVRKKCGHRQAGGSASRRMREKEMKMDLPLQRPAKEETWGSLDVVRAALAADDMGMGPYVVEQHGADQSFWGGVVLWFRESLGDARATSGGANAGSCSKAAGNGGTASDDNETRCSGMAHDDGACESGAACGPRATDDGRADGDGRSTSSSEAVDSGNETASDGKTRKGQVTWGWGMAASSSETSGGEQEAAGGSGAVGKEVESESTGSKSEGEWSERKRSRIWQAALRRYRPELDAEEPGQLQRLVHEEELGRQLTHSEKLLFRMEGCFMIARERLIPDRRLRSMVQTAAELMCIESKERRSAELWSYRRVVLVRAFERWFEEVTWWESNYSEESGCWTSESEGRWSEASWDEGSWDESEDELGYPWSWSGPTGERPWAAYSDTGRRERECESKSGAEAGSESEDEQKSSRARALAETPESKSESRHELCRQRGSEIESEARSRSYKRPRGSREAETTAAAPAAGNRSDRRPRGSREARITAAAPAAGVLWRQRRMKTRLGWSAVGTQRHEPEDRPSGRCKAESSWRRWRALQQRVAAGRARWQRKKQRKQQERRTGGQTRSGAGEVGGVPPPDPAEKTEQPTDNSAAMHGSQRPMLAPSTRTGVVPACLVVLVMAVAGMRRLLDAAAGCDRGAELEALRRASATQENNWTYTVAEQTGRNRGRKQRDRWWRIDDQELAAVVRKHEGLG